MSPSYPFQRRQMTETRNNQTIDVDRVRAVEIHDTTPEIQSINLEPEFHHTLKARPFRFNNTSKNQSNQLYHTKKQTSKERNPTTPQIPQIDGKPQQRENITHFKNYREKLHKLLGYFISIYSFTPNHNISSENIFNIFQQRKSLHRKMEGEPSLTKFLFQISYTNYLSFLIYVINLKQHRYDIYSEPEELQKVLFLIDQEIQEITQNYLSDEQKKIDLIFSEELLEETSQIARKNNSRQNLKVEGNIESDQRMMLETDEKLDFLRQLNQTESDNTNLNPVYSEIFVHPSKDQIKGMEGSKLEMRFQSEQESGLQEGQILPTNEIIEEESGNGSGQLISSIDQKQFFKENGLSNYPYTQGNGARDHINE